MSFLNYLGHAKELVHDRATMKHFITHYFFYSEELLAPHPIPKLEDHPLSTACD
jgi:hypothetical protein